MLLLLQVNILKGGCVVLIFAENLSVNFTTLEVEDVDDPLFLCIISVGHEDEMHGLHFFHLDGVHPVDASEERCLGSLFDCVEVFRKYFLESLEVALSHGLNDESFILREKEEASRFALGFACLKHCFPVILRTQAFLQIIFSDKGKGSKVSKDLGSMLSDFNIFVDDEDFLFLQFFLLLFLLIGLVQCFLEINICLFFDNVLSMLFLVSFLCEIVRLVTFHPALWVVNFNAINDAIILFIEYAFGRGNELSINERIHIHAGSICDCLEDDMDKLHVQRRCQEAAQRIVHILFFHLFPIKLQGLPKPAFPSRRHYVFEIGLQCTNNA
jgi:hypothetical protein